MSDAVAPVVDTDAAAETPPNICAKHGGWSVMIVRSSRSAAHSSTSELNSATESTAADEEDDEEGEEDAGTGSTPRYAGDKSMSALSAPPH